MKTLRASKLDILWNVRLPQAMYFFASLKIAVTLAFIGVVLSRNPVASTAGISNVVDHVVLVRRSALVFTACSSSLYHGHFTLCPLRLSIKDVLDHRLGSSPR